MRNTIERNLHRSRIHLLPRPFNGSVDKSFVATRTQQQSTDQTLQDAAKSFYYSYHPDFERILGPSPTIDLIESRSSSFAHEAGVWVAERNEVWFTAGDASLAYLVLDLDTKRVYEPNGTLEDGATLPNLAGGDIFEEHVYFASLGNESLAEPPSIYAVDIHNHTVRTVLNSYYGLPLNSIDDVSIIRKGPCRGNIFFTSLDTSAKGPNGRSKALLPNAIYRLDPSKKSLQAVISRADILAPNGVHATAQSLYASDAALVALSGPGSNSSGSPAIYKYDIDDDCRPVNKRLFALTRTYISDGIKVDAYGRVWAAEGEGIVVRDPAGHVLGVFNGAVLDVFGPIGNFALAGKDLVVLADTRLWVVGLGQDLTGD
ncbi:hypothetical protein PRZ48_011230 [Zasmidium cellare]|uniref:SMP-30/Gluconolactonase/LRE-like region domain-containing protein n=1 Tax=Zasmidium cellare TaxID=395010 RepID=A0ABR0EAT2_ZASCE|nr:hypothetical protein PRZ48_011230 [Zasmidium cellare]